ncbi:hypothetical protein WJX77_012166 [Trebouxia sp. C0004]
MEPAELRQQILSSNKTASEKAEDLLLEREVNEMSKDEWRELIAGIPEDVKREIRRLKSADLETVDAETNETPVRSFKVSRNHQGKLFLDGIKEALANRGLVLLGIGEDGFPAHKDGWTMNTFNASPVQLIVGPKPGVRFVQAVAYPTQQIFLKQIWQAVVA